jgi:FMN-dependent NADH-azoreductase
MSKVLVLNSSALGGASVSNQLVQDALVELRARDPGLIVTVRDLGANPIPHLNSDSATALRGAAAANEAQATAQELSDTLIAELKAADTIVIRQRSRPGSTTCCARASRSATLKRVRSVCSKASAR